MKINVGKWLRRQVFRGEPVTLANFARLAAGKLGYESDGDDTVWLVRMGRDLAEGRLTAAEVKEVLDIEAQRVLAAETRKVRDWLEEILRTISN